eukprot:s2861_g17.t1
MLRKHHLLQQELQLLPWHLLMQPPLASLLAWLWAREETDNSPPVACALGPEETWNGTFATRLGLGLGLWLCLSILLSFRSLTFNFTLWVSLWLVSTFHPSPHDPPPLASDWLSALPWPLRADLANLWMPLGRLRPVLLQPLCRI